MLNISRIKIFKSVLAITLLASALILGGLHYKTAKAADVGFANFWVGKVTPGSGHIGVDMWWPTSNGAYIPCNHSDDAYYGACILSNSGQSSYYKVMHFTPTSSDFPYGIFIDNQNQNHCTSASWCTNKSATSFNHGWARLSTDGSIEIYPYDSNGQYNPSNNNVGGVRVQATFPNFANGGKYSGNVGDITLPQLGQAKVGKLNGFATDNGSAVSSNRVSFDAFEKDHSLTTSTGYPMTGFTSVKNSGGGYYNVGAVPSGAYKLYVTDNQTGHKIILDGVNIFYTYERLDFKLEQRCFGNPNLNCTDPA